MSSALVGISPTPVEVPPVVHGLAARLRSGATVVPVWRNEYGGLTVRLGPLVAPTSSAPSSPYLKWVPDASPSPDPLAEADRLVWAGSFTRVPHVLDAGRDAQGSWLLTAAVETDGEVATSAVEPRWRPYAERAAIAIGVGLRRFHDTLPTDTCPFVRTARMRVAALTTDASAPLDDTERAALDRALGDPPPPDRLVVCHGDATVPNTLLDRVGRFAAHVDVGDLGVGDRWSDLAVTTRSVSRRYGPGLEPLVLAAYGVAPDPERIAYYRALWDAEEAVRARRAA